jgi:hypothetical protein
MSPFFVLYQTMWPHIWQHPWTGKCFFSSSTVLMFLDWVISSLQYKCFVVLRWHMKHHAHTMFYTLQLIAWELFCTLSLKTEYALCLTLIFLTDLTICKTSCNNYAGNFQGHLIEVYNLFLVTNLFCLYSHLYRKQLIHIYQSPDILITLITLLKKKVNFPTEIDSCNILF